MKKSDIIRLLGNTKADFADKLEEDAEFKAREFQYINTSLPIAISFSTDYHIERRFQLEYITTDNNGQSFYGHSSYYGHNVYVRITDTILKTLEIVCP